MYRKSVLPNGVRVVTHDMKERDSVSMGFWIGVGGRYEEDQNKGAAHFLEHILFKGSKKYSCDAIKEQIEGVGGSLNAFTSEEQTCYYAKIPGEYVNKTFDILSDMVMNPSISKKDVEREKTVIIEEIKMYHDLPQYFVMELLDNMMWPNHPLGKNLAGTQESVSGIDHRALQSFHERHYGAWNIVVAAAGNIRHQDFVDLAQRRMKKIKSGRAINFFKADGVQNRSHVKFYRKDIEQMHLALGMLGVDYDHKDKHVMTLLNVILGGNMSSRLFNVVREKKGLAYAIGSSIKIFKDTGMLLIRAGVDNNKIVEATDLILKELRKIRQKGVSKSEFTRAKDYYLGQVLLGLEDTLDHMLWLGESMTMRNQLRTLDEVVQRVKRIKIDDVQRVAKDILKEKQYNLAIVGPIQESQEEKLSKIMNT